MPRRVRDLGGRTEGTRGEGSEGKGDKGIKRWEVTGKEMHSQGEMTRHDKTGQCKARRALKDHTGLHCNAF